MLKAAFVTALTGILAIAAGAAAQDYPTRPMTLIIPFAAGGPTDVLGRIMAARMSDVLGNQIIVENVAGGGGQVGSKRVADAPPDGYLMGLGTVGTHAQGQTLYKKPLYNSATDFTPVALIADVPIVLAARKDLPVKDLKEFVVYARKNQDKMSYGTGGIGAAPHLGCLLLNHTLGTNITHVPYRGSAPGDAGSHRRPHRFHMRGHHHRQAADRRRFHQGAGDLQQYPFAGDAEPAVRRGAGRQGRILHLECNLPPQGRARRRGAEAQRRAREAMQTPAVRDKLAAPRRAGRAGQPGHAPVSRAVRPERDREVGGPDQGERPVGGLKITPPRRARRARPAGHRPIA